MIVVTVGTQFFDGLVQEVDRLVATGVISEHVWAQIGLAGKTPQHLEYVAFDRGLIERARDATLIITHAGTGSLCEFITLGRPMIAVANQTKAGNHQIEFLEQLSKVYDFCWVASPADLAAALPHARPPTPLGTSSLGSLAEDLRVALVSA